MGTSSTKSESSATETRHRILDAAQQLFADHGFNSVSLRQITSEAGVNLAGVNYHFGSKDALITEVFSRMLTPINEERVRLLDIAEADAPEGKATIEDVLYAMYRPVISRLAQEGREGEVFLKLSGRCMGETYGNSTETMMKIFETTIERFMAAFRNALPHLKQTDLTWRFHFAIGTKLYMLTKDEHLLAFSGGELSAMHDGEQTLKQLVTFVAGGLKAPAVEDEPVKPRKAKSALITAGLAAAFLLSSCAGKSPAKASHHAKVNFPKHWVAAEGEVHDSMADRNWVESFHDAELSSFVEKALEQNLDLKTAAARVEVAGANARIAGADIYPKLDGGFSGRRSKQNFIGFPFGGGGDGPAVDPGPASSLSNQFGLSLDLSWELDLWGRLRAAQSAAIATFEASDFDRSAAELSLAAQATKAWFAIAEAREQVALAEKTLATFGDTESVIRDRFKNGLDEGGQSLSSQLLLAESDVATAKDSLATRQELVERTSRQLEILAGEYPAGKAARNARLPRLSSTPPAGMPGELLDRRPDIAAAERRLAATDRTLLEAKRTALPRISLTSSGGTSSEDIRDLLDRNFSVWSLAGNLAQPILSGGIVKNGIQLRKAELRVAISEFESTALTAFGEVENALAAEKYLRIREVSLTEAARVSEEAYKQAREEYGAGTGDLLTMLTAQQRAFSQKSQAIAIRRQRLENRVDLHLALGGSFESQPAKNEIAPEPAKPASNKLNRSNR